MVAVLWRLEGKIAEIGVEGWGRWGFGRGRPLGGSLLRLGRRRLGRRGVVLVLVDVADVVVVAAGVVGCGEVVGIHLEEELGGGRSVLRRSGAVFVGGW